MGYEQLPPEVPMWRQDRACKNCEALNERIKVLEGALKDIARQNLESEIHEDFRDDADFNEGYDCIIRVARAALEVKS
jgi:hypothetical protein